MDAGDAAVTGTVRSYSGHEGWGVIDGPDVPGGCFVHFSMIQMPGYRELQPGQRVRFTFRSPGQDGCAYTAVSVWPG